MPHNELPKDNFQFRLDSPFPILAKDMSKGDYIDALKKARWNNDYSQEYFKQYFGIDKIDDLLYSDESISIAMSLVVRNIFPEFVETKGLKINRITLDVMDKLNLFSL